VAVTPWNDDARPGCGEEMRTMVTVEFTMEEAHAVADALTGLVEPSELIPGTIDRQALRTADEKIINDVGTEEFCLQAVKLN
jgi:hypothetical protein